jgi:hypothetical protein
VAATYSRGGLALAAIYLAVAIGWKRFRPMRRYGVVLRVLAIALFLALPLAFLIHPSLFQGVTSSDPTTASLQYRGAVYSTVISSLEERPFGWGTSGVPAGEFTFRSQFGVLDVNTTTDSEFVVTVLDFGYIGLILWAVISVVAIMRVRADSWWSHVAVLVTAAGFYLSIHSWLGILGLWAFSIGAALARREPRDDQSEPDGYSGPAGKAVKPAAGALV